MPLKALVWQKSHSSANIPVSTQEGLVEHVPATDATHPLDDYLQQRQSTVAIRHGDHTIALCAMRRRQALEPPIAAAVLEVPAFALPQNRKAHGIGTDAHWRHLFLHCRLRDNRSRSSGKRPLVLDHEFCEVGGCGP